MKHTPGPWKVFNRTDVFEDIESGNQIADCWITTETIHLNNAEANARLIAAAPKLLLSIQTFFAATDMDEKHHAMCQMEEAIAATKGA